MIIIISVNDQYLYTHQLQPTCLPTSGWQTGCLGSTRLFLFAHTLADILFFIFAHTLPGILYFVFPHTLAGILYLISAHTLAGSHHHQLMAKPPPPLITRPLFPLITFNVSGWPLTKRG